MCAVGNSVSVPYFETTADPPLINCIMKKHCRIYNQAEIGEKWLIIDLDSLK